MSSFAQKNGSTIEITEIMPDHVHMVIALPSEVAPSSIVKSFKGAARERFKYTQKTNKIICGVQAFYMVGWYALKK